MVTQELSLLYFLVMQRQDVALLYNLSCLIQDIIARVSIVI